MNDNWNRRQWLVGLAQALVALLWSWQSAGSGIHQASPRSVSPKSTSADVECFTAVTVYDAEGRVVSVTDLQARDTNRSFDR